MDRASIAKDVRRIVVERSKSANTGHIGSALSIVEILVCLFWDQLKIESLRDPNRDRFVLSKGHASLALYAVLYLKGRLCQTQLDSFCADDSHLGVHPESDLDGIDFSTGSLGMGLSYGAGAALAAKLSNASRKVFVLISDAECNEGALWEAAMFAAHHKLDNLVAIVDLNGQQALGYTADVLQLDNMEARWQAFGWQAHTVDGHDIDSLNAALGASANGRPQVVIAKTTFGKGVSFMHNRIEWHYSPLNDEQFSRALNELEVAR
ncbi:MAG TPA: transketolase [Planktothrix sp.]|jgi:transketolase